MAILGDTAHISVHKSVLKTWINIGFVCLRKHCLERTADLERQTTHVDCSHGETASAVSGALGHS
jgi:hypothetical protein